MTKRAWMTQSVDFRARVLNGLPDAEGIEPDALWDSLPYWLQRYITHFVPCVCHEGSVCNSACAAGRCHTGCAFE